VRRQQTQGEPALARALGGVAADQPHEDRHERQSHEQHERRAHVDVRHPAEHDERHDRRQHELRQVTREVGLEAVDALDGDRRDLPSLRSVERRRLEPKPPLHQREA
jgi:hypothetical protein